MKMKIFLAALFLFAAYPAENGLAQKPGKEIEFGVGIGTIPQFVSLTSDIITGVFSFGAIDNIEVSGTAGISAGYSSRISGRAAAGVTYVFEYLNKEYYSDNNRVGSGDVMWNSLMGSLDYYWIDRTKFSMFSGVGLGFSLYREKQENRSGETDTASKGYVAFQVDLLGFEFGRQFNVTTAFGFGQEGLIALRLGYRY